MRIFFRLGLVLSLLLAIALPGVFAAPETLLWKPIALGVLKVDERPVKSWEIYVNKKYKSWFLVQIGARFLLLDAEARAVFELDPAGLQRKHTDLAWTTDPEAPTAAPSKENGLRIALPSEEWTDKAAGRARIIRLKLSAEGRRLDVQLPATPDLRKFY